MNKNEKSAASAEELVTLTDGLQLSSDNRIHNIRLKASPDKRAIFNDTSVASLGRIELRGVTTIGSVQILARDNVRGGHDGFGSLASDCASP